jgi:hypothetical protein
LQYDNYLIFNGFPSEINLKKAFALLNAAAAAQFGASG